MLDPDIRRLLDTIFSAPPPVGPPDIAELRAAAEAAPALLGGPAVELASIRDVSAPGPAGPLPLRIYMPDSPSPLPLVLYAHGGGWVTGSLDSHDKLCRILAQGLRALVVAVDYRLAPESPYPAALDDVEAAWRWAGTQAHALGAHGGRFALAGDSSGANLAAALTLRLRRDGAAQPCLQLLLYPALDATCSRASYRAFASGHNLTAAQMAWYWDSYRGRAAVDAPELSPLAAADLAHLPPAVIAVAAADVLRDDGLDYARRLESAGVPVRVVQCTGMIHGFLRWTGEVPAAARWIDAIVAAARGRLAPERA
ncbi:MAG TPA: alpha/beta hydrolase [Casimicrobiaceae bacterium]